MKKTVTHWVFEREVTEEPANKKSQNREGFGCVPGAGIEKSKTTQIL